VDNELVQLVINPYHNGLEPSARRGPRGTQSTSRVEERGERTRPSCGAHPDSAAGEEVVPLPRSSCRDLPVCLRG
jgi:hypothetical protein